MAADPSSDIPGVPLPGPVAAGRLGGAIYDVVYSLTVAAGYVIVASVTGTAGTDFDIYLFDATATTVLSDDRAADEVDRADEHRVDLVAVAIRRDLLHRPERRDRRRRRLPAHRPDRARSDAPGRLDRSWPGASVTNQLAVPVTLTATDDLSGVTEMALSADGVDLRRVAARCSLDDLDVRSRRRAERSGPR